MARPRETKVEIGASCFVLLEHYNKKRNEHTVSYRVFYSRYQSLKKRNILSFKSLDDALKMKNADWITSYGGGKRKGFTYQGDSFAEHKGQYFSSLSLFLKTIGKYAIKGSCFC